MEAFLREKIALSKGGAGMRVIDPENSELLIIDFQKRLMPAIDEGVTRIENARMLLTVAGLLKINHTVTEQNPHGLGTTVAELAPPEGEAYSKMTFDGMKNDAIADRLLGNSELVVAGCEAHVCVLQTVLGALDRGKKVFVVADAIGSRSAENRTVAIDRMRSNGAEIVTTEMVLYEWLVTAEHAMLKTITAMIKN